MSIRSPLDIPSCPRCGKRISVGMSIERARGKDQDRGSWVHVGCVAPIPPVAKKASATPPTKKAPLPGGFEVFDPAPALAKPAAPEIPTGITWVTEELSDHAGDDAIHSMGSPSERESEKAEKDVRVEPVDNPEAALFSDDPEDSEGGGDEISVEDEAGDGTGVDVSGSEDGGEGAEWDHESNDGDETGGASGGSEGEGADVPNDSGAAKGGGGPERNPEATPEIGWGESDSEKTPDMTPAESVGQDESKPESSFESSGSELTPKPEEEAKKVETVPAQPKKPAAPNMADVVKQAGEIAAKRVTENLESRLSKMIQETAEPITDNLVKEVVDKLKQDLKREFAAATESVRKDSQSIIERLKAEIDRRVDDEVKKLDSARPVILRIEHPDGSAFEFVKEDIFHSAFPEAMKLASNGFNVFLPGPSGCGKTMMSAQIAKGLGLPFAMVSGSSGTTETELFGYSLPNISTGQNVYIESDFVRVYEQGGCFLADEIDAMDSNCVLKLNAAMSNGFCTVPKRFGSTRAVRHPRFVLIAAANTYGSGATRLYCGRNRLDESTLDRLRSGCVPMDYDPAIERRICPNAKLYATLTAWRKNIVDSGLQRILSTRFVSEAYKLKAIGYTDDGIAKKLTGGWTTAEVVKVIGKALAA